MDSYYGMLADLFAFARKFLHDSTQSRDLQVHFSLDINLLGQKWKRLDELRLSFEYSNYFHRKKVDRKCEKLRFGLLEGEILVMERRGEDCRSIFISDISLYLL